MSVLVVVPARGGSKGIPGKNLREVGGLSLVARAVIAGRVFLERSGLGETAVLLDTDDEALADEGRRWGAEVPFLRPAALAGDATPTFDSVDHALGQWARSHDLPGTLVLLQPTSPLRSPRDIAACWTCHADGAASAVTVTRFDHPPQLAVTLEADGRLRHAFGAPVTVRRQDLPAAWRVNGAVYVQDTRWLRTHRTFVVTGESHGVPMPAERSVDIDHPMDLVIAEALWRAGAPAASRRFVAAESAAAAEALVRSGAADGLLILTPAPAGDLARLAARVPAGRTVAARRDGPATPGPDRIVPVVSATRIRDDKSGGPSASGELWIDLEGVALDGDLVRALARATGRQVTLLADRDPALYPRAVSLAGLLGWSVAAPASASAGHPELRPDITVVAGMDLAP